jgi:hypothetical protein
MEDHPSQHDATANRRRFLKALGAAGIVGLAGCFGDGDGTESPDTTGAPETDPEETPTETPEPDPGETPIETDPGETPTPATPPDTPAALALDGESGRVRFDLDGVELTDALSFEMWVKVDTHDNNNRRWLQLLDDSGDGIYFSQSRTGWNNSIYGPSNIGSSRNRAPDRFSELFDLGTWAHVAFTAGSGDHPSVYINGENIGDLGRPSDIRTNFQNPTLFLPGTEDTADGVGTFRGGILHGEVREVRLWDRALGADEIQSQMDASLDGSENGLVGYWPVVAGNKAVRDRSGNGNHGETMDGVERHRFSPFSRDLEKRSIDLAEVDEVTLGPVELRSPKGEATYQWYHNGDPIEGATGNALRLSGLGEASAGTYHVEVDDEFELPPATSASVLLIPEESPIDQVPDHVVDYVDFGITASDRAHGVEASNTTTNSDTVQLGDTEVVSTNHRIHDDGSLRFELDVEPDTDTYVTLEFWGEDLKGSMDLKMAVGPDDFRLPRTKMDRKYTIPRVNSPVHGRYYYATYGVPDRVLPDDDAERLSIQISKAGGGGTSRGVVRAYAHTRADFSPSEEAQGAVPADMGDTRISETDISDIEAGGSEGGSQSLSDAIAELDDAAQSSIDDSRLTRVADRLASLLLEVYDDLEAEGRLTEGVSPDGSSGETVPRGELYIDLFERYRTKYVSDIGQVGVPNQQAIVLKEGYAANRALKPLSPETHWVFDERWTDDMLPEGKAVHENFTGKTAHGVEQPPVNSFKRMCNVLAGERRNYWGMYDMSPISGMVNEAGYTTGYGAHTIRDMYRLWEDTQYEPLRQACREAIRAFSYFQYPSLDADGYRLWRLVSWIGWRQNHTHPGDVYPLYLSVHRKMALDQEWPTAIRQTELYLQDHPPTARTYKNKELLRKDKELLQSVSGNDFRLPAERDEDVVLADPYIGLLAVHNNDEHIFMRLIPAASWRQLFDPDAAYKTEPQERWTEIRGSAIIAHVTDGYHQLTEANLREPLGSRRLAEVDYGDLMIRMNMSEIHTYPTEVEGHRRGVDLISGETYDLTGTFDLEPLSAVVLYVGDDEKYTTG